MSSVLVAPPRPSFPVRSLRGGRRVQFPAPDCAYPPRPQSNVSEWQVVAGETRGESDLPPRCLPVRRCIVVYLTCLGSIEQ